MVMLSSEVTLGDLLAPALLVSSPYNSPAKTAAVKCLAVMLPSHCREKKGRRLPEN